MPTDDVNHTIDWSECINLNDFNRYELAGSYGSVERGNPLYRYRYVSHKTLQICYKILEDTVEFWFEVLEKKEVKCKTKKIAEAVKAYNEIQPIREKVV